MHETWRPVVGWEKYYEVSDLGRVRSLDRLVRSRGNGHRVIPGRILAQSRSKRGEGYFRVNLWVTFDGVKTVTNRTVHSMMADAFLGVRDPRHVVCHDDDDPTNNVLANIRHDTQRGNVADRDRNGHYGAMKTHCTHGHEYTEANTKINIINGRPRRRCRQCQHLRVTSEAHRASRRKVKP